ncbi:hypothetical protein [Treponema socranskii]|uniref:hypothetical protein n=1 Tax=Treponema socranskii TaxID=53419 RepID=UPI00287120FE|nr:hypothetical protein [Treponema socranskii]MDR9859950.1 hypothetical protein [Treponema socranskii]
MIDLNKEQENPSSAELATSTKCEVPRAGFSCVSYASRSAFFILLYASFLRAADYFNL